MTAPSAGKSAPASALPEWAAELVSMYESDATNQFILHGNVQDRFLLPGRESRDPGSLSDFLRDVLLPGFEVVLTFDLGNGIRVEKGGPVFSAWPWLEANPQLPRAPRPAIEVLTHYFRYCANLAKLGRQAPSVACIVRDAGLVAPAEFGATSHDLSSMALLMRDWCVDTMLATHRLATFLITENLNDLSPILSGNTRAARIEVPLPRSEALATALTAWQPRHAVALERFASDLPGLARQLTGATLSSVESLLKTRQHAKSPLEPRDIAKLKKDLVESDCNGLIEFVESEKTLDALHGLEGVKKWLRQDIALWNQDEREALPMGYLVCGPVGTGKTFLVNCLAGEAGVPVVKLKNFRDKWVGSTEGNLEKIFRLLHALGRCFVFIDEADQSLGKRDSGKNDSGLSGRVYSMIAQEMSDPANRGRILWILATSRPDLVEVDLKRPGRVDVKIPIFPTATPAESYGLLRVLTKRRGIQLPDPPANGLVERMPVWLTPGAAESLAMKLFREVKTSGLDAAEALARTLEDYQPPVPEDVMRFQIQLALREASDLDFVPAAFRTGPAAGSPGLPGV